MILADISERQPQGPHCEFCRHIKHGLCSYVFVLCMCVHFVFMTLCPKYVTFSLAVLETRWWLSPFNTLILFLRKLYSAHAAFSHTAYITDRLIPRKASQCRVERNVFKFVIGPKTPSEKAAAAVATKEIKGNAGW